MGNVHANLHSALINNDNDKVLKILKNIESVNMYNDKNKCNLLHFMITCNAHISYITYIVESKNCDINEEYENKKPIELALQHNRRAIIRYLVTRDNLIINHEINKNLIKNEFSGIIPPTDDYMFSHSLDIVKYAINREIAINIVNAQMDTPFFHAVKTGNYTVSEFLIKYTDINDIKQAIHHTNHDQIIALLINNGAIADASFVKTCESDSVLLNIILTHPRYRTQETLFHAVKHGLVNSFTALIVTYEVPVNGYTHDDTTILEIAKKRHIAQNLLRKGANISPKFLDRFVDPELWDWIIENGHTNEVYTAYYVAKNTNINIFVKLFNSYSDDMKIAAINYHDPNTLDTCLHLAFKCFNESSESRGMEKIIPSIRNINHVNAQHQTLLHIACNKKCLCEKVITKLIECKIDKSIVDNKNKKAFDYIVVDSLKQKYRKLFAPTIISEIVPKKINCPGCGMPSDKACVSFLAKDVECTVCLMDKSKMVMIIPCGHTHCCVDCYKSIKSV